MTDALATEAAALWGIPASAIRLAARRENVVYRADTPDGLMALRLHRPGYRSQAELRSELEWMAQLAKGGLRVPHPAASINGHLVEMLDDMPVSLLSWMPGTPAGAGGRLDVPNPVAFARDLGRIMAQLHNLSDNWTPPEDFRRPHWNLEGLLGDRILWGPFWENPDLTPDQRDLLLNVRARARIRLAGLERDLDYGLIHADILTENVLVDGAEIALIDFDDGGYGFREFELATFLMRFLDTPDYPAIKAALLEGYTHRRAISPSVLDFFILLRALTYPGWIIPRRDEPGGRERSLRAVRTAVSLAEAFMKT